MVAMVIDPLVAESPRVSTRMSGAAADELAPGGRGVTDLPPPLFTLVLATYGRSEVLGPMLDSLVRQSLHDFELVVVDQNRDDRVVPMLEPVRLAGIPVRHLRAEQPNLSAARNLGIEAAQGSWVAFPDDDCWYEPDCLARMAAAIAEHADVQGWVASWVEVGSQPEASHPFDARVFRAFRGGDASSITLFLRIDAVRRIAGFDARIGVGRIYGAGEETDLVIRLLDDGATIRRLPQARVHHHHSHEQPLLTRPALAGVRKRERGVGALYAKHRLRPAVIARGLTGPILRALVDRRPLHALMFAGAVIAGRIDGMLRWRLSEGEGPQGPQAAAQGITSDAAQPGVGASRSYCATGENMGKRPSSSTEEGQ